jgi:hypothetical protein
MDYGYLERQQKFYDNLQKNDFLNLIQKYAMPEYNANNLQQTRNAATGATSALGDPYQTNNVGGNFGGSEFSGYAKNAFDTTNNLNVAEKNLSNNYADWNANDTNDMSKVNNNLTLKNAFNALTNSQAKRMGSLTTTNMTRASTDKINALKLKAAKDTIDQNTEKMKSQSESDSWINAIAALATIVGSIYATPAGGMALGAGVKAGGTAIARNNGR